MSTTEAVFNYLQGEGYLPESLGSMGVGFKAQGRSFVFINNDEDEHYFHLALPNIHSFKKSERVTVLEAANKTTNTVKVAKVCVQDESVWIMFEIMLDDTPDVGDIIPRAITILLHAQMEYAKFLKQV